MSVLWAKYRQAILSILLLGLPLLFFYSNAKSERSLNFLDEVVLKLSAPVQEATRWLVDGAYDLWEDYVYLREQSKTNARLSAELGRLRGVEARLVSADQENERLRKLLDFHRAAPGVKKLAARVIARSVSPYFRVYRVRIDAGSAAGIRPGMPVVTGDGVVGRIHRAYGDYADVQLIADPESSIDVIVQGTRATGFLRGRGESNNYRCRIEHLALADLVRDGDVIVTSGVGAGNPFPKGLVVGRVSHVIRKQYGVSQEVEVLPAVDFSKVEEVFVLRDGAGVFVTPPKPGAAGGTPTAEMPSAPPNVDGGDDAEDAGLRPEPVLDRPEEVRGPRRDRPRGAGVRPRKKAAEAESLIPEEDQPRRRGRVKKPEAQP